MAQIFRPYADTVARAILLALVVMPFAGVAFAYWIAGSEYVTDQTTTLDQPVPFSHQHHVGGLGLDCRYCHTGVETSAIAGVPPTRTCMTCHSQLYTQAAMLAPVRASLAEGRPIHWSKVNGCRTTFISIIRSTLPRVSVARPVMATSITCR